MNYGPQLEFSDQLHAEKYRTEGETFRDKCSRVAAALTDTPEEYHKYREMTLDMRFLEAGRIQSAVGSTREVTPYNCFVSRTLEDSTESICETFSDAMQTMRRGGGIGYDWSPLRPKGALIRSLGSSSSGPLSFMQIFSQLCHSISSAGHRRGAQMAVLRVDHPDIEAFIQAKHDITQLTGFNLSVAITDEFMECKESGKPFKLRFNGESHGEVDSQALWEMIMRSTWDYADPGVLFIDTINNMNNLWYCEKIAATNPCGEQPLPPNGACLLGSFNLVKYVRFDEQGKASFDWNLLREDVRTAVPAMDRVIDVARYPLPAQELEAKNKRRMGLGITGLANAGEAVTGSSYGSKEFLWFANAVQSFITNEAYSVSIELARTRGEFSMLDREKFVQSKFVKTLHPDIAKGILKYGIRNSHLTSIAPTGTISMTADYVSSGCEPVFGFPEMSSSGEVTGYSYAGLRQVNLASGPKTVEVRDYGERVFGVRGKMSHEVTAGEHVDVLLAMARNVDSAVSKTVNVNGDMPWADFKNIYQRVWEGGGKGCTTFNADGKKMGILMGKVKDDTPTEEEAGTCVVFEDGSRECG